MALKLSNNAISSLLSAIPADSTSIILKSGDGAKFPSLGAGDYFPATLSKSDGSLEIVKVTGRSGDTLTATRGKEGTTALSFDANSLIEVRLTAATVAGINAWTQSIYVDPATGITTIDGTTIPTSKTLLVSTDIGATVQAYDADLTTLGAGGAPARAFLGLAIGTDVQAYNDYLQTIAQLTPTSGNVIKGNGDNWTSAPIQTLLTILNRSAITINISLANAFLPVTNRSGSTVNVVTS